VADTITVDNGALTDYVASTDERTIASVAQHVQRISPLGGSTIANGHVAVTNSATEIRAATETQHCVTILNNQTVAIYVGAATVTTSAGFRLDPGAAVTLHTTAAVQGITSAAYTAAGEDDKVHYLAEVSA
jgi:hypothetical protein